MPELVDCGLKETQAQDDEGNTLMAR